MISLGAVLGWKFNDAGGIVTANKEILEWPIALGNRPTKEKIETWTKEYEVYLAEVAAKEGKISQAKIDLASLQETHAPIEDKLTIQDLLERVKKIEIILGL